jgi:hypothetical protein
MPKHIVKLILSVTYDSKVTDSESIASAMDTLLETAASTPGILDEYGDPEIGQFYVESYRELDKNE